LSRSERVRIIQKIEKKRDSRIISYFTGDRQGLVTQVADDAVRLMHSHLQTFGRQKQIDLFLYTRGGVLMAPLRIVQLVREYCQTFQVLVPYRAHSAGTLICLGADKIVMGRLAELTPVDPSTANDFNPQNPLSPAMRIPISVEDVTAYLSLAEKKARLTSENTRLEVFRSLTNQINAIALGNVHRVYGEIRSLVDNLLRLHMTTAEEKKRIPAIVKTLTETYTHDHLIPRVEGKRIGLKVETPDDELEALMTQLYEVYEKDLLLREAFNPDSLLGAAQSAEFSHETAYVESTSKTQAFVQAGVVSRSPGPVQIPSPTGVPVQFGGLEQVTVRFMTQGWQEVLGN